MTNRRQWLDWISSTLREAGWAPLIILGAYGFAFSLQLFKSFPPLDLPYHLFGGILLTYFYRVLIRHSQKLVGEIPRLVQIFFAITCTSTTTVLWEFYENLLDFFFGTHTVRGVQDTIVDLFLGLLGALIFSLLYRKRR